MRECKLDPKQHAQLIKENDAISSEHAVLSKIHERTLKRLIELEKRNRQWWRDVGQALGLDFRTHQHEYNPFSNTITETERPNEPE